MEKTEYHEEGCVSVGGWIVSWLREAKRAAIREYGGRPGFEGFGASMDGLRFYVRDEETAKQAPSEFDGIPVEVVVTGGVVALSKVEPNGIQKRAQTTDKVKAHEALDRVRAVLEARRKSYWKENPLIVGGGPMEKEEDQ